MDRTLVICKPDAVERGLVGEIVGRFERKGLSIVALELRTLDADTAAEHYEEHVGKGFYDDLVAFITRGPVVGDGGRRARRTRGRSCATMMGATNPAEAAPGTIRGDLGVLFTENLVHGTDSAGVGRTRDRHLLPGVRLTHPLCNSVYERYAGATPRVQRTPARAGHRRLAVAGFTQSARHRSRPPAGGRTLAMADECQLLSRSWAATWPSISARPTRSSTCAARASCSTSRRSSRSTSTTAAPSRSAPRPSG